MNAKIHYMVGIYSNLGLTFTLLYEYVLTFQVIVVTHAYGERKGIRYLANGLKVVPLDFRCLFTYLLVITLASVSATYGSTSELSIWCLMQCSLDC